MTSSPHEFNRVALADAIEAERFGPWSRTELDDMLLSRGHQGGQKSIRCDDSHKMSEIIMLLNQDGSIPRVPEEAKP